MNLVDLAICPACGHGVYRLIVRVCSNHCMRSGAQCYVDTSTLASPVAEIHLHVTCSRCGFVWLAPLHDPNRVKEAW